MPRTQPPLAPQFALAWSFSRHRLLTHCHRALYWQYFGCRGQGLPAGDRSATLAWALRHLTTVPLLIGSAVHVAARLVLDALVAGRTPPALDDLHDGARLTLNAAWRSSQPRHVDGFWEHPAIYVALQEIVGRGRLEPFEILRARGRLFRALEALVSAPVLADLEDCAAGETYLPPPGPLAFAPLPGATAWGALDFAYRHHDMVTVQEALHAESAAENPEGGTAETSHARAQALRAVPTTATWCVSDFKTGGGTAVARADEALQLGAYGLWMREAGYPSTDGVWLGRIIDLTRRQDRWYVLDAALLAHTQAVISADLATLHGLMADPVRALPQPKEAWALAADQRGCPRCRFRRLCAGELASGLRGGMRTASGGRHVIAGTCGDTTDSGIGVPE